MTTDQSNKDPIEKDGYIFESKISKNESYLRKILQNILNFSQIS